MNDEHVWLSLDCLVLLSLHRPFFVLFIPRKFSSTLLVAFLCLPTRAFHAWLICHLFTPMLDDSRMTASFHNRT